MSSRRTLLVPLLMAWLSCGYVLASAATYYISPSGSDANAGTQTQPWLTMQKGLDSVAPGDTLSILSGNYYVTTTAYTKASGTSASPITIQGQSNTWLRYTNTVSLGVDGWGYTNYDSLPVLTVSNSWYVVKSLNLYGCYISLYSTNATHNICASNLLTRGFPISFGSTGGSAWNSTNGPSFNTVRFNIFTNMLYNKGGMGVCGNSNFIETNQWWNSNDSDAIEFHGISNVFRGNLFVNIGPSSEHDGNHVDMFQTWGDNGERSHWTTIEGNVISNCAGHFFIFSSAKGGSLQNEDVSDIMVRNNLIINSAGDSFLQCPRITMVNNTFLNPNSGVPSIYVRDTGGSSGVPTNCVILNNIVAGVPHNSYPLSVDDSVSNTTVCAYNFLSRIDGQCFPFYPQCNNSYFGANNIAGGTPCPGCCGDGGNYTGGDAGFVSTNPATLNLQLLTNSSCYNAGTNLTALFGVDIAGTARPTTGPWDMGAYQHSSGIVTSTPPVSISPPRAPILNPIHSP